jgi:uncharacterized protein YijF (DUF1287 family)
MRLHRANRLQRSLFASTLLAILLIIVLWCEFAPGHLVTVGERRALDRPPRTVPEKIVAGALGQVGDLYYAAYIPIPYPNGDVPKGRGACTDVVVRAYRRAGIDLQRLVHEDMAADFDAYPHKWGLDAPDPSIDHRRVPNLQVFFTRHGLSLPCAVNAATLSEWRPGDVVTWRTPYDHTGIISDRKDTSGIPLVIHNMGRCSEMDCLTTWKITGHYRYPTSG